MASSNQGEAPGPHAVRVADLGQGARRFDIVPEGAALAALAEALDLVSLKKLRLSGELTPRGKRDWHLVARLGATVEQRCTVTLAPVRTRIEADVERLFLRDMPEPEGPEVEMPEDDRIEPLGAWIDLDGVLTEALALELPAYPRADGVDFEGAQVAGAGITPMQDEDARPFAALKGLRDAMDEGD